MLTEEEIIDQISVDEYGNTSVRKATVFKKDGVEFHRSYHRHVVACDDDDTNEDPKVKAVRAAYITSDIRARHQEKKEKAVDPFRPTKKVT